MDRSERKIKQTVSHNAETADRDRVKNKETSDYTRKYATPLARSSFTFGNLFAVKIIGAEERKVKRVFRGEESAALSGNKHIPDLDKKKSRYMVDAAQGTIPVTPTTVWLYKNITYAKEGVKIAGGKGNPRHIRQARSPFGSILFRIRGIQKSRIRIRSRRDCKQTAR